MSRDGEGDITNYLLMAKTKADEKALDKQPKKLDSEHLFNIVSKHCNRNSLEQKFQKKIQTAVSRTEHTVTTEVEK